MILFASNVVRVQVAIGLATGILLAVLGAIWRWTSSHVATTVAEIRALLVTDENGLGIVDRQVEFEDKVDARLGSIEDLIAQRTPIFDEVRVQVKELVRQSGLIVDRTETLTPNGGGSMHDQLGRLDAANTTDHAARPARPVKKAPAKKAAAPRRRSS